MKRKVLHYAEWSSDAVHMTVGPVPCIPSASPTYCGISTKKYTQEETKVIEIGEYLHIVLDTQRMYLLSWCKAGGKQSLKYVEKRLGRNARYHLSHALLPGHDSRLSLRFR